MRQLDSFSLFEEKKGCEEVTVTAKIEEGCLEMQGHVFDDSSMACTWRDEREYIYRLDRENTAHLISLLTANSRDLKQALSKEFGGKNGFDRLRKFCEENGLKYEYTTRP